MIKKMTICLTDPGKAAPTALGWRFRRPLYARVVRVFEAPIVFAPFLVPEEPMKIARIFKCGFRSQEAVSSQRDG